MHGELLGPGRGFAVPEEHLEAPEHTYTHTIHQLISPRAGKEGHRLSQSELGLPAPPRSLGSNSGQRREMVTALRSITHMPCEDARRGLTTSSGEQQCHLPDTPAKDRNDDRCMWAGWNLITLPPLACTHGHRTQRSLFFAAGRGNNTAVHRQLPAVPQRGLSLAAITRGFGPAKQTLRGASAKLFQLSLGQTFHETNWRAKNHTQKHPKAKENRIVEQQPWEEPKSVGRQQGKLVLSHCKLSFIQIQVILNDIFPMGTE